VSEDPRPGSRRWRKIRNELRSRGVNEKIESLVENSDEVGVDHAVGFFCECADDGCRDRISISVEQYGRIHDRRDDFIVRPGHQALEVERVVESEPGYLIVRKADLPAT
jgi:hypothetical protein